MFDIFLKNLNLGCYLVMIAAHIAWLSSDKLTTLIDITAGRKGEHGDVDRL